jgi:hypothetical protein
MAVTINKTDGTVLSTIQDGAIDISSTNLSLIGRLYRNYGELVNENFVKLLENFANSSAPTTPIVGQIWYNTTTGLLNVFRSNGFVSIAVLSTSSAQPNLPKQGDLWFDTSDAQLKLYTGAAWDIVSPQFNSSQTKTGVFVETRRDALNSNHICIVHYQQNSVVAIHCRDAEWTPQTAISGFTSIKPGFNLAAVNSQQFVGTVTNAANLGNIQAARYLRNDISGSIDGSLTLANEGLILGEFDDLQAYIDGPDAYIAKPEGKISFLSGLTPILNLDESIQAQFANGTEAEPSITFISDTDSGMFRIDEDTIGIGVDGTTILEISDGGLFINGSVQADNFSGVLNASNVVATNIQTVNLNVTGNTILGNNANDSVQIQASNISIPNGLIFSSSSVQFNGQVKLGDILTSDDGIAPITIDPDLYVTGDTQIDGDLVTDGTINIGNGLITTNTENQIFVNTNTEATGYYNPGDITLGSNIVDGFTRNNAIFARNVPKHVAVFDGSSPTVYNAHHVATVTKVGTGVYVLTLNDNTIDIPLISAYPEVIITANGSAICGYDSIVSAGQTSITIRTYNSSGSPTDYSRISVAIWDGDVI